MGRKFWIQGAPWGALALAAVVGGCNSPRNDAAGGAESAASGAAATMDSAATGMTADTGTMSAGSAKLSDANIVALLDEANKADSAAGALAATKGTSADVKRFAKLMMTEHHALRLQGQQLAKKLNITPEPPANDPVQALAKAEMDSLKAAPKGAKFDRTYIDQEVGVHKAVIDLAEKAHGATQNQELKNLIEKAKPILQTHLDRAESIQKKLGSPSA